MLHIDLITDYILHTNHVASKFHFCFLHFSLIDNFFYYELNVFLDESLLPGMNYEWILLNISMQSSGRITINPLISTGHPMRFFKYLLLFYGAMVNKFLFQELYWSHAATCRVPTFLLRRKPWQHFFSEIE